MFRVKKTTCEEITEEMEKLVKKIMAARDPNLPNYFAGVGVLDDGRVTLACHGKNCSQILAWEGLEKLPQDIIEWDWYIAQLTSQQWLHIIVASFDMEDMISNVSRMEDIWKEIKIIVKGAAKPNPREQTWHVPHRYFQF